MSRRGKTKKPCHGCGESGLRPIEGLCVKCRRALDKAKEIIAAHEARKEIGVFGHGRRAHMNPQLYSSAYDIPWDEHEELSAAFQDVVMLAGEPTSIPWHPPRPPALLEGLGNGRCQHWEDGLIMAPEMAHAIRRLFAAIEAAVESAYKDGKRRGSSVLLHLAGDRKALDRLEEATIGSDRWRHGAAAGEAEGEEPTS